MTSLYQPILQLVSTRAGSAHERLGSERSGRIPYQSNFLGGDPDRDRRVRVVMATARRQTRVEALASSGPMRGQQLRSRTASRVAVAGIAGVLLALTGFALWAASTTNQAALHAAELTHLNDAYQRARFAVATEDGLAHEYRHKPGPELRARFAQAARSLNAAVQYLHQHGDAADRDPIVTLEADHRRYLQAVYRLFAAVDAGDQRRILALDEEIEPLFERIEADVELGATHERNETLDGLAALRRQVVVATPIILGTGLGLLIVFCAVLVGYQRRTERQAAQNQHQALHDALTGLPNRTLRRDRIGQAIRQADRELAPAALALLDLDRFKEVNDTLGHHYGDQLLVQVGQRLQAALRAVDTVARLGGDEFAVLLPRVATGEGALAVAGKLQAAMEAPFVLEGLSLEVEASIGVALYPEHGNDPEELLQHADIAMYVAKDTPGSCCSTPPKTSTAPAAWPCWASSAGPSTSTSCCSTTNPRSTPTAARSWGSRPWCAGNTPPTG